MGALEHASHFGWNATARGTLDIYDRAIDAQKAKKKSVG
jgi:D-inositol-3-phosphate glycosyltransferase